MSSKRKLQQAYKEVEDLKSKEDDAREEFEELQKKVKKAKAMVQDLQIDLVKQNKIKWREIDFNDWEDNQWRDEPYICFHTSDGIMRGIFQGYCNLTKEEKEHFEDFKEDYLYYKSPNYNLNGEESECEQAFGSGDAWYREFFK